MDVGPQYLFVGNQTHLEAGLTNNIEHGYLGLIQNVIYMLFK